jgi:alginate O-acetyltransferase complex protein AlgI
MLFNSYGFLLVFLPIALAGCFVLASRSTRLATPWLVLASLVFYGWWEPHHVGLLVASIGFNYLIGECLARCGGAAGPHGRTLVSIGVGADLCVLGYFKYIGFLTVNANALFGTSFSLSAPLLPLGISFFTFTQIAYLVDVYREPARYPLLPYALFVTYFPHLIAGPILHHKEMLPQFQAQGSFRLEASNLAAGITIFSIGLFKKIILADGIAPYSSPVFEHATQGYAPGAFEAWGATLAFGLQLYFDFSAYSDMAIGLSKMFGIRIPVNFHSPYKARSIIEFWRRWHMTLSRFLREYLYFALGGNRRGAIRRYANLLTTMLLGGLWHGAAWTFVIWGAVHGILIAINHAWRSLRGRYSAGPAWYRRLERYTGALLTFVAVFAAWTFFRAQDLPSALLILKGMAGMHGFAVPPPWLAEIGEVGRILARTDLGLPAVARDWLMQNIASLDMGIPKGLAEGRHSGVLINKAQVLWTLALLGIAWFMPNTNQIMARARAFLFPANMALTTTAIQWRMGRVWAITCALLLIMAFSGMSRVSEFLYFQF